VKMVAKSERRDTDEAKQLIAQAQEFRSMAEHTVVDWMNYKRAVIEALKSGEDLTHL